MKQFGLIGKTLDYSFSKTFFTEYFEKNGINASYSNFPLIQIEEFKTLIESQNLSGLNVTIPYKESVISFLDELSDEAKIIGAVNTIQFKGGKLIGHNTDAYGFHQSIKPFLTNRHERALILGTGGASKAVDFIFKSLGIDVITISRNPKRNKQFSYSDINEHMLKACKVIVNCTPVGTSPNINDFPPIPFEFLAEEHLVVDLIYNPSETTFLRKAKENNATILNGYAMLQQQALKAWEIWESDK